jgi:predicted MFS family arabinose efflux permease
VSAYPTDAAAAAAAIPVVSQLGQAVVAALGGVVVNAALPSYSHAASNLFALIGTAALLGVVGVLRALIRRRSDPERLS